jgi:5,10-methylenetetrahydrofolate reductase
VLKRHMVKDQDNSIQRLLQGASFEAHYSELPSSLGKGQEETIRSICATMPQGTDVYIPHVAGDTLQDAARLSNLFKSEGLNPITHICARRLSERDLEEGIGALAKAGVDTALILGGDVCERNAGSYKSAKDLLISPIMREAGFKKLLFGGHPEGNRLKTDQALSDWDILVDKLELATNQGFETGVVTQASYNPAAVIRWVNEFNDRVHSNPTLSSAPRTPSIDIGIVGPASLRDKFDFASLCQFDSPWDVVRKVGVSQALGLATNSKPDHFIAELAGSIHEEEVGLRFSTLNNIQSTLQNYVRPLREGRFRSHTNMFGHTSFDIDVPV